MTRLPHVATLLILLTACGGGKRFTSIDGINVYYLSEIGGLAHRKLTQSREREIKLCLINGLTRITEAEREIELLPTSYLIEVTNSRGTVSMELLSKHNVTDREGFYQTDCLWDLVRYDGDEPE